MRVLMKATSVNCRLLRDLCYTFIIVIAASALLTYHFTDYLQSRDRHNDVIGLQQERTMTSQQDGGAAEARIVLEGLEFDMRRRRLKTSASSAGGGGKTRDGRSSGRPRATGRTGRTVDITSSVTVQQSTNSQQLIDSDNLDLIDLDRTTELESVHVDNNVDTAAVTATTTTTTTAFLSDVKHYHHQQQQQQQQQQCTDDESSVGLLWSLSTFPVLQLFPAFNSSVYADYYATVAHNILLVRVEAVAHHCQCQVTLGGNNEPATSSNFTLGLGVNRLVIYITDTRQATIQQQNIVNTYTLTVYRQHITSSSSAAAATTASTNTKINSPDLKSCSLQQDCDLQYLPEKSCGLQSSVYGTWTQFVNKVRRLTYCTTGSHPGEWILPCSNCSDVGSCDWQNAVWQPFDCTYWKLQLSQLKPCLAGKKVLFIGDSTNRGMMHYIMEQVNGSLTEWDKTHDTKVYSGINNNQTTISFTYYPQFWMAPGQRPVFEEALQLLLKMNSPLDNSVNTVLVVGGVHWLSTQHLNIISNSLRRLSLSNIQVIIKSLGAGFHQPVEGLHHLTLSEQQQLVQHNNDLMVLSHLLGFDFVDTFHLTMARYKDFLQGKCACHFHRVKEVLPSFSKFLHSSQRQADHKLTDMPIHYHVEGDINTVYSDILLTRICGRG